MKKLLKNAKYPSKLQTRFSQQFTSGIIFDFYLGLPHACDKYEVLGIRTLADTYTYPDEVLKLFQDGQWTMSVKGRPYHNLALDEAHECIINRKLKQITDHRILGWWSLQILWPI